MANNKKYTLTDLILDLADSFDWGTSKLIAKTYQDRFVVDEELHKNRSSSPYEFSSDAPPDSYTDEPNPIFEVTIKKVASYSEFGFPLPTVSFNLIIRADFTREGNWNDIFDIRGNVGSGTMCESMAYLFSYQTSCKERNSYFADIHPDHIFTEYPPSYMHIKASRGIDLPRGIEMNKENQISEMDELRSEVRALKSDLALALSNSK